MDTSLDTSGTDEVVDRSFRMAMGQFGADEMAYLIRKGMVEQVDGEWRERSTLVDSDLEVTDDEDENKKTKGQVTEGGDENKKNDLELTDDEDENKEPNGGTGPLIMEVPPNTPSKPAEVSVYFTPKSAKGKDGPRHSMLLRSVCRKSLAVGGTPGGVLTPHDANTSCCASEDCRDTTLNMMYKTPMSCRKNVLEESMLKEESLMEKDCSGIEDVPPVPLSNSIIDSESFNASLLEQSAIVAATPATCKTGMVYHDSMNMSSVDFIPATQQIEHVFERTTVITDGCTEEMLTEIEYSAVQSYMQASHLSNTSSDFGDISRSQVHQRSAKQSVTFAGEDLLNGTEDAVTGVPLRGDSLLEEVTDDDEVGDECDVSFEYRRPSKNDKELKESSVDDDSYAFDMSNLNHSLNDSRGQMSSQKSTDLDDSITVMEKLLAAADQLPDESISSNIGVDCSPMMFSQDVSLIRSVNQSKFKAQQTPQGTSAKKEVRTPDIFATPRAPAPKRNPLHAKPASGSHSAGAESNKMIPRVCRLTATEMKPAAKKPAWNSPKNTRTPPIKKLGSILDSPARRLQAPASVMSPLRKPIESPVGHYIRSVPTPSQVQRMAKPPKTPVSVSVTPKSGGPKCGIPTKILPVATSRIPHFGTKTVATASPTHSRLLNHSSTATPPNFVHRPSRLNSLLSMKTKPLSSNVHYVGSAVKPVNAPTPTSAKKLISLDSEKHAIKPIANRHLGIRDVNNDSLVNENPVVRKFCPNRFGFQPR